MTERRRRALQLVALWGFAGVQPLLDALARHPELLASHDARLPGLVLLVVTACLLPPLLLAVLERGFGLVGGESASHLGFVSLLVAVTALPWVGRLALPAWAAIGGALVLGVAAAAACHRVPLLARTVNLLAVAPLVFAGIFFGRPEIAPLVRATLERAPDVGAARVSAPRPVVLVVFDELPLASLLDPSGEIDAVRYPHFARLAARSTWFRNATTVDWRTPQAVASLLTGRYPDERPKLAIRSAHPRNLFQLLDGDLKLHVTEAQSRLAPADGLDAVAEQGRRVLILADDLAIVYGHVVLPASLAEAWLPPVHHAWRDFGRVLRLMPRNWGRPDRAATFREFVSDLSDTGPPTLHFIHLLLPHTPWRYLPSGSSYHPFRFHGLRVGHAWPRDEWWVIEGWQRHLLQLGFVDRLLGELLDRLESTGLDETALLILTADHGMSFRPGENARDFAKVREPADHLAIPLFVRLPGQSEAARSDRNVELVDVLPTIAEHLGVEHDWPLDGCSLLSQRCPHRPEKRAFTRTGPSDGAPNQERRLAPETFEKLWPTLAREHAWFGSGDLAGLYRLGPFKALVGQPVDAEAFGLEPAGRVFLDRSEPPSWLPARERGRPVRVSGRIELPGRSPGERPWVAVAWAGVIRTVVGVARDREGLRIAGLLPEEALDAAPAGPLSLHLVDPDPGDALLRPLELR